MLSLLIMTPPTKVSFLSPMKNEDNPENAEAFAPVRDIFKALPPYSLFNGIAVWVLGTDLPAS